MESLNRHEDYGQLALEEFDINADPIRQFSLWLAEAEQGGIFEPNAFVLGTVGTDGKPTARTVLLRGVDADGFYFYTNYQSRKGQAIGSSELAAGAPVSMVFGWYSQYRQVLVEGYAEKVEAAESDAYFNTRPRDSQIAAWASNQSQPIENRAALDAQYAEKRAVFATGDVARPPHWGGYRIVPTRIEFWKGRSNRMHDRIEFGRTNPNAEWAIRRLQP
jgi:pyridoxamine 5'-phosphate oxidase